MIQEESNYYPFGLKHEGYNSSSLLTEFGTSYKYKFLGQELQENGFYDLGARFYVPELGIFGQHDPLSGKTLDPYGYAYQNPIFFSDPTGLEGDPVPGSSGTGNPQAIGTAASPIDVGEVMLTGVSKAKQMDSSLSYMGIQSLNNYQASKYRLNEAINNCRECKQLESVEKGLFIGIPLTLATGGIGGLALSGETTAISLLLKASGSAGMQYTATGDINIMSVVGDTFGAWGTGEALGGLTELSYEKLRNGAPAFRTVFDGSMSWSEGISNVGIALIGKGITNANTLTKVGAQGLNKGIVNVNNFLIGTAAYRAAQVNAEEIKKNK